MIPQSSQNFLKQMDNPWLRNQVDTHLFFGNYKWKYLYLGGVALYIIVFFETFSPNHEFYSLDIFKEEGSAFVIAVVLASFFHKYEISAFFWAVIKVCLLFFFFIFLLVGIVNTLAGEEFAYLLSILGVVWLPSVEFIKKITPYQKFITLFRVIVTVPMVCVL